MTFFSNFKRQLDQWVATPTEEESAATATLPPPNNHVSDERPLYTHGLEKIYSLQNVDPRTVRPLASPAKKLEVPTEQRSTVPQFKQREEAPEQLDLGAAYRGWMESFRLSEPITVLGLSQRAEQGLGEQGIQVLRDLVNLDPQELVYAKGLGQGHLDEIQQKLESYMQGRPLERATDVDFFGLIRCLFASIKPKQAAIVLQPYGLDHLFHLSPAEAVEVRHISAEQREVQRKETLLEVTAEKRRRILVERLGDVVDVFIRPWIRGRVGLATESEVLERLLKVSEDPESAGQVVRCLSELYFEGKFPLRRSLPEVDDHVFAADEKLKELYGAIVRKAKSYFAEPKQVYPLEQLVSLIEREYALRWEALPTEFCEKTLRLSTGFRVRKGSDGKLQVKRW